MPYPIHPIAEVLPPMSEAEFDALCASVRLHGLKERIVLHQEQVVDGRHRQEACEREGVTPLYKEWDGIGTLEDFVTDANITRRHLERLDASQRAYYAAEFRHVLSKLPVGNLESPGSNLTYRQAAERFNVSERSVGRAETVRREGVEELKQAVKDNVVSVSEAEEIAKEMPDKQRAAVAQARNGKTAKTGKKGKMGKRKRAEPDLEHRDAVGARVPSHLADAWAATAWIQQSARDLTALRTAANSAAAWNPYLLLSRLLPALETARECLENALPHIVHEACGGTGCQECRQSGWLTEWRDYELENPGAAS